jgi:hypothetical protein
MTEKLRPPLTKHWIQLAGSLRPALSAGLLAGVLIAPAAFASPLLRCQIDQGGSTQVLEFAPVSDPYSVKAIDINGRFRFKAVVIGDERHIEYIKLYTYSQTRRQPVLLHVAKYLAPVALPVALPSPAPAALTGLNYVYSPQLERELQYGCALLELAP